MQRIPSESIAFQQAQILINELTAKCFEASKFLFWKSKSTIPQEKVPLLAFKIECGETLSKKESAVRKRLPADNHVSAACIYRQQLSGINVYPAKVSLASMFANKTAIAIESDFKDSKTLDLSPAEQAAVIYREIIADKQATQDDKDVARFNLALLIKNDGVQPNESDFSGGIIPDDQLSCAEELLRGIAPDSLAYEAAKGVLGNIHRTATCC